MYGTPPYPNKAAMSEAWRVLAPGGFFCILHHWVPYYAKRLWRCRGLITVVRGTQSKLRAWSLFQKLPQEPTP